MTIESVIDFIAHTTRISMGNCRKIECAHEREVENATETREKVNLSRRKSLYRRCQFRHTHANKNRIESDTVRDDN